MKRRFHELNEREVLALALAVERANTERFATLADLYEDFDDTLRALFLELRDEEVRHTGILEQEWMVRFGDEPRPTVGESEVEGVIEAVDLEHGEHAIFDDVTRATALRMARRSEEAACRFYQRAASCSRSPRLRELYLRLAAMEGEHVAALDERPSSDPATSDRSRL